MPPRMVYAGSRMGHHLIRFKGRFNWPVEPGDLKNKWEWTKLLRLNWTELKITKQKMTLWPTKKKEFRQSQQCYLPLYVICSIQCIIVMLCILFIRDFVGCHACHRYFRLLLMLSCLFVLNHPSCVYLWGSMHNGLRVVMGDCFIALIRGHVRTQRANQPFS